MSRLNLKNFYSNIKKCISKSVCSSDDKPNVPSFPTDYKLNDRVAIIDSTNDSVYKTGKITEIFSLDEKMDDRKYYVVTFDVFYQDANVSGSYDKRELRLLLDLSEQ
jgi:hypothetical protein